MSDREWKEYSSAKNFLLSSVFWLVLFTSFGFILAIKFFAPEFLGQTSFLTFGRVRPMHVNGVAFGFLSTGLIGAGKSTIFAMISTLIKPTSGRGDNLSEK